MGPWVVVITLLHSPGGQDGYEMHIDHFLSHTGNQRALDAPVVLSAQPEFLNVGMT